MNCSVAPGHTLKLLAGLPKPVVAKRYFRISEAGQGFDGIIDDVAVFNTALTRQEIMELYKGGAAARGKDSAWIGTMPMRIFDRARYGQVACEVDFRGLAGLPQDCSVRVTLQPLPARTAIKTVTLAAIPEEGKKEFTFNLTGQPEGRYEISAVVMQGEKVVMEKSAAFEYPTPPVRLPAPQEASVAAMPAVAAPMPYQVVLGAGGGFTLNAGGKRFAVESLFSYPNGGENGWMTDAPAARPEAQWRADRSEPDAATRLITSEGTSYRVSRRMELRENRIVIQDTFTNKGKEPVGILLSHRIRPLQGLWEEGFLSGYNHVRPQAALSINYNPTLFLRTAGMGLGVIALDDVFIMQSKGEFAPAAARLLTDNFALDGGASYTLEWAIYPTASGEYYDFINAVRRDEGRNGVTLQGAFTTSGSIPRDELLARWNIKYLSVGQLSNPPDDPGISLEGIEFIEYPKIRAALRQVCDNLARSHPDIQRVFHIAHNLYATNKPNEKFPDSRIIGADGKQGLIAPYSAYFSKQRVAEGWNWYGYYPTLTNSFSKALLQSVDVMFDDMHATGGFMDGFSKPYAGEETFDQWDGHTAEIDPKTKLILRKKGDVVLLSQDAMIAFARKITGRGGAVIVNNAIITRSIGREQIIVDKENTESPYVHLAQTPVSLGRYLSTERDAYLEVLRKLSLGNLHFFYPGDGLWPLNSYVPSHDHVVCQMYPITVQEVHAGWVKGSDRLVTMNSGTYGWPGDRDLHCLHFYDAYGWEAPHSFYTTVDEAGVRTAMKCGENEMAVLRKIPVTLSAAGRVNVLCTQYDAQGVNLLLNGEGKATLELRNGEFKLQPGAEYKVEGGEAGSVRADAAGKVALEITLHGQTTVRVMPAAQGKQ